MYTGSNKLIGDLQMRHYDKRLTTGRRLSLSSTLRHLDDLVKDKNDKISAKRRIAKNKRQARVREVSVGKVEPFQYAVFVHSEHVGRFKLRQDTETVMSFAKESFCGSYKVKFTRPAHLPFKVVSHIYIEDEGDFFSFMMCHKDIVRKAFKYV